MRDAGSTAGAAVTVATSSSSPYWAFAFHGADGDWAIQPDRILTPNLPVQSVNSVNVSSSLDYVSRVHHQSNLSNKYIQERKNKFDDKVHEYQISAFNKH